MNPRGPTQVGRGHGIPGGDRPDECGRGYAGVGDNGSGRVGVDHSRSSRQTRRDRPSRVPEGVDRRSRRRPAPEGGQPQLWARKCTTPEAPQSTPTPEEPEDHPAVGPKMLADLPSLASPPPPRFLQGAWSGGTRAVLPSLADPPPPCSTAGAGAGVTRAAFSSPVDLPPPRSLPP